MRDIYKERNNWKIILLIAGFFILLFTTIYSNYLASNLKKNEEINTELFIKSLEFIQNDSLLDAHIEVQNQVVESFNLPTIFKNENGALEGYNFPGDKNNDSLFLQKKVNEFLKSGKTPIKGVGYSHEIYSFHSPLLDYIKYYPIIQVILASLFITLGYVLFNSTKRAEQNRVWAGMAKETAHQLGTPISALLAWLVYLRENTSVDEEQSMVLNEIEHDIDRLNLIADRFSKIGSTPELLPSNIIIDLNNVAEYMKKRSPKHMVFSFPSVDHTPIYADINKHLFEWVIENMMRNSLDAMEDKGTITARAFEEDKMIVVELMDTGKGIPSNALKKIFQPGFTTKQRGWGLGLSLAKRIIQDYHNGKIYVKYSKPDEGTCFVIKLPKSKSHHES